MFSKMGLDNHNPHHNNSQNNKNSLAKYAAVFIACLAIALPLSNVYALPDDSQQAIVIKSNSAVRDDKQGVTIYSGNVNMTQGSMRISANKVTLFSKNNDIVKIVAEGGSQRASFKQQPRPNEGDIEADAQTIEYHLADDIITLLDDASLKQADGSMISSNKITYDVSAARVEAGGENGQVETIINPKNTFE